MSIPVLEARGLTKRFGGFCAVDDISLTLHAGIATALIGPNGAGKTTLFDLITGRLRPDSGSVRLHGEDVSSAAAHDIARRGIGRSFQEMRLFGALTVYENIAVYAQDVRSASLVASFARPLCLRRLERDARRKTGEVLEYLGIATLADVRADTLGFAQQKLVAIGRLLALGGDVLFLDEPASGLDHHGRATLTETMRQLAADGYTVCFIEHNAELVRSLADRVVFVAEGKVIADGVPAAVFDDASLAEVYFGVGA